MFFLNGDCMLLLVFIVCFCLFVLDYLYNVSIFYFFNIFQILGDEFWAVNYIYKTRVYLNKQLMVCFFDILPVLYLGAWMSFYQLALYYLFIPTGPFACPL